MVISVDREGESQHEARRPDETISITEASTSSGQMLARGSLRAKDTSREAAMLTDHEIAALFRDTETDRAERKRNFQAAADRVRQAICAYANDLPNHQQPGLYQRPSSLTCDTTALMN